VNWAWIVAGLGLVCAGCSSDPRRIDGRVLAAFADFTFVGESAAESVETADYRVLLSPHGGTRKPLPDKLKVGVRYVFHHRHPVDGLRLALVELPQRLEAAGVRVLEAPRSESDLMSPFIGGPLFVIKMGDGVHEGLIYNQHDPRLLKQLNPRWVLDDFVLLWTK
jgi:hypothetical protein